MRRFLRLLPIALAVGGCAKIDKFLEGDVPPEGHLVMALDQGEVTIPRGGELSLTVTITRPEGFAGASGVSVDPITADFSVNVGAAATTGRVTLVPVTVKVGPAAAPGRYIATVRGHGAPFPPEATALVVTVIEPPAYDLSLSRTALAVTQGGSVPLRASLRRTSFPGGVTLSLLDAPGISAGFSANPVTDTFAVVTVTAAPGTAPGAYHATLRGIATGLADRSIPVTVTVTTDPVQLVVDPLLEAAQGSTATMNVVVNRNGVTGSVALAAEGLPAGTSASFLPATPTGNSSAMMIVVGPATAAGSYPVTVRGSAAGVPDATTTFDLRIVGATITLSASPDSLSLLTGTSATTTLALTRSGFDGAVDITAEGGPAGLTVTSAPGSITGQAAVLTASATAGLAPGRYSVTVRGSPAGLSAAASRTVGLTVIVSASHPGSGNLLLDWSRCTPPDWVAAQDGSGPWIQLLPASNQFRFDVTQANGAFAVSEGGIQIAVRYLTRGELTAAPFDMCPSLPTKTISGTAAHTTPVEVWNYALGGGTATSTGTSPNFTIGVRDGIHDFLGWGTVSIQGVRGMIRRDVDLPPGGSLGTVGLTGIESFTTIKPTINIIGAVSAGDRLGMVMRYLTTAACTINPLYILPPGFAFSGPQPFVSVSMIVPGVPETVQRADDYHMLTVLATGPQSERSTTRITHLLQLGSVPLPPIVPVPSLVPIPGGYKRLGLVLGDVASAYNRMISLEYVSGAKTMSVSASIGYAGSTGVSLAMPDLRGVSGWPESSAMSELATGSWTLTLDGVSSNGSLCTENRTNAQAKITGLF